MQPASIMRTITLMGATALWGCTAKPPPEPANLDRASSAMTNPASRRAAPAVASELIKPMLGVWVVNVEATLAENPTMPPAFREDLRREYIANPFDLTITDRDFISRGPVKTIHDRYVLWDAQGSAVTIELTSADREETRVFRRNTLWLRDGKLLIDLGAFTCVFSRKWADELKW